MPAIGTDEHNSLWRFRFGRILKPLKYRVKSRESDLRIRPTCGNPSRIHADLLRPVFNGGHICLFRRPQGNKRRPAHAIHLVDGVGDVSLWRASAEEHGCYLRHRCASKSDDWSRNLYEREEADTHKRSSCRLLRPVGSLRAVSSVKLKV